MKKILVLFGLLLMFSSCASLYIPVTRTEPIEKIALSPVLIGSMREPVIPLIDAAIFVETGPTKLKTEMLEAKQRYANLMRTEAAKILADHFNSKVLTAEDLQELEAYRALRTTHDYQTALSLTGHFAPFITIAEGDVNPYNFENGHLDEYLNREENYKSSVIHLCNELDVDALATVYSRLYLSDVSGGHCRISLEIKFFLFDDEGNFIARWTSHSSSTRITGKLLSEFTTVLNQFPSLFRELIGKVLAPTEGS